MGNNKIIILILNYINYNIKEFNSDSYVMYYRNLNINIK